MIPDDLKGVLETIRLAQQGLDPNPSLEYIRAAINGFYRTVLPAPENVTFRVEEGAVRGVWSETGDAVRDRVILHFHGGGFYTGDVMAWSPLWSELGRASRSLAFSVDYRLAPEHPYPAALDDASAAYEWLLDQGYAAKNVVLCGDSAGAALAVGVMLKARDAGRPLPAGAYLVSPWVDMENSGASYDTMDGVDPITNRASMQQSAGLYLQGHSPRDPLVSPIHTDLRGLPPVLVHVGAHEVMLDDAIRLARQFAIADVSTRLEVWPHLFHIFQLWHAKLDAGRRAIADAARFVVGVFER